MPVQYSPCATKKFAIAAAIVLMVSSTAGAATLDYDFSFRNFDNGNVTGVIRGLKPDATGPATSVEVLTNSGDFGIGEYFGGSKTNIFTVTEGQITYFNFISSGIDDGAFPRKTVSFSLVGGKDYQGQENVRLFPGNGGASRGDNPIFTLQSNLPQISLPAASWLLLGGLGALMGLSIHGRQREV